MGESQGLTRPSSLLSPMSPNQILRRDAHAKCAWGEMGLKKKDKISLYPSHRPFCRVAVVGFRDRSVTAYKYNDERRVRAKVV